MSCLLTWGYLTYHKPPEIGHRSIYVCDGPVQCKSKEVALEIMTHETRSRLGCPLCRCPWPEEDQVPLSEIIAQLRLCRTRKVAKLAMKLETAFQQARRRRYKKCFA